jgi:hypothetical protein
MRDVAALAGVGLKTVSRVVYGVPTVAPELVIRVQQAADKLATGPTSPRVACAVPTGGAGRLDSCSRTFRGSERKPARACASRLGTAWNVTPAIMSF